MRARIAARVLMDHQLVVLFPEVLRQARVMHAVVVDVVDVSVKVLKERDARWVFGRRVGTDVVGRRGEFTEGESLLKDVRALRH
jgi:hypothetical protein